MIKFWTSSKSRICKWCKYWSPKECEAKITTSSYTQITTKSSTKESTRTTTI